MRPWCLILLLSGCAAEGDKQLAVPLAQYLPESISWEREGSAELYEGDDLFIYINGGAEIYHEYGFRRVLVQEYVSEDRSITLEIYEMDDAASAFGLFTFKRGRKGGPLTIGHGARLEGYYINFWKGNFQVTLTGHDEESGTVNGLKALGSAVDQRIGGHGEIPILVSALPQEGLLPSSVKYLEGRLGLMNCRADFLDAREAVLGDYEDGARVVVFAYPDEETCRRAYSEAGAAQRHGRFIVVVEGHDPVLADKVKSRLSF